MSDTTKVEEIRHSKLGASGASRWMSCAGSINITEKVLAAMTKAELAEFKRSSPAASEGTAAHELCAICLQDDTDAWEHMGRKFNVSGRVYEVDQEMSDGVQLHLDTVRGLLEEHAELGAKMYVEVGMQSNLDEEAFGTSDVVLFIPGTKMIVVDFKYGRGIVVEPDSTQNRYYAALALEHFESEGVDEVELWITQPRIPHPKGKARKHSTTAKAINDWFIDEAVPAMAATRDPNASLATGEQCRFCPAKQQCPALKGEVVNFSTDLDPDHLRDEELGGILQRGDSIRKYLADLETEAFKRAKQGLKVSGYKLVRKRATRVFKEGAEEALIEKYGEEAYQPRKVVTPPQVEKLDAGKAFVSRWAFSPDTGLTLAAASDKRDEVVLSGEEAFGEVD